MLQLIAQAANPPAQSDKTLLGYVHDGGLISYVLVMLSVVALSLVIRNIIMLRRDRFAPDSLIIDIRRLAAGNDVRGIATLIAQSDTFMGRVLSMALRRCEGSPFAMLELRSAIEDSAGRELERTHRVNDLLAIIAAVAPMLGLLGTVIGMIGAFATISSLQGVARSNKLAEFMSMALVNTAEGLIVAIPATIVFGFYRRKIDSLADDATEALDSVASVLQKQTGAPRQPPQPRPAPAPAPGQ